MSLATWFRGSQSFREMRKAKGEAGIAARRAAREELGAAKAAVNPAHAIEKRIPELEKSVHDAETALQRARENLHGARRALEAAAGAHVARIAKAEDRVRATANSRLRELWNGCYAHRDRVRRGIVRVPPGAAEDIKTPGAYWAALNSALDWASATMLADHEDGAVEREVEKLLLRLRLDQILEPEAAS